ncbi:ERAD-associated E3 ubiquitin-protein ligase HRD1 [Dictyocoela roeselum]|nr:ERAD-associated E3 ubiquitin-protein ligase HRD1 [Dictyocoela roeselum]
MRFRIDILFLMCKMVAYLIFFFYTSISYRIPFNVFRELIITFRGLVKKIYSYHSYRAVVDLLMKCEVVDIAGTARDDGKRDANWNICPICQEEMAAARKVSCGHLFHLECLLKWAEQQQVCPICRRALFKKDVRFETRDEVIQGVPVRYE